MKLTIETVTTLVMDEEETLVLFSIMDKARTGKDNEEKRLARNIYEHIKQQVSYELQ